MSLWNEWAELSKSDKLFDLFCIAIMLVFLAGFLAIFGIPILIIHLKERRVKHDYTNINISSLHRD